jgi:hypothetical protein
MTYGGDAGVIIRGLAEIVVSKRWRERYEMKTPQERPVANKSLKVSLRTEWLVITKLSPRHLSVPCSFVAYCMLL